MRPFPSNDNPTQNGEPKCGTGNQGEEDVIKEFKSLEVSFRKTNASGFIVRIGGSSPFWSKSMWGQIWIF